MNVRKEAIRGSLSRHSFLLAAQNVGKEYHGRNGTSSKVIQVHLGKVRGDVKYHFTCTSTSLDLPQRKLVFNKLGYLVSPSERAQVQRPISPLEIIISAMWIASGGFLGSP